jgi:hypothetical protein
MKVTNLTSVRSGAPVANQFELTEGNKSVFQSYDTTIASKEGYKYTISGDYNYSVTTNRYFGQWLREYGWTEEEIKTLKKWLTNATEGDTLEVGNCNVTYINEL